MANGATTTAIIVALTLLGQGCSDSGEENRDGGNGPRTDGEPEGGSQLTITIVSPKNGATDVSVSNPTLKATFNHMLKAPDKLQAHLIKDGTIFHGLATYSATELRVVLKPFNTLQSRSTYSFKVSADDAEASVTFTTEKANEGSLPAVDGTTYDFRLTTITHPEELASLFNAQLKTAPPLLLHVVSVTDKGQKNGNSLGTFQIAGSTGKVGDPKGQSQVLAEDSTHTTTTSMAVDGHMEGSWFGAGPSDLHLTAAGVPLVIRDFFLTGIFAADGKMGSVTLTGLIDPAELGKALNIDLTFICQNATLKKYCDEKNRIRVAGEVDATLNPIQFTTFTTKPVNASEDQDTNTTVQAYFSEEVDQTSTTIKLQDDQNADVSGKLSFGKKSASFTPDSALKSKTTYSVETVGMSKTGMTDTRHSTFTTM